jgi:hypothetical protein
MGEPKAGLLLYSIGVVDELRRRIEAIWVLHYKKLEEGVGEVYIPEALVEENSGAAREIGWQWVFPAKERFIDPCLGREMRHHVLESGLQKAVKRAVV